jgi:tetratricopeptide (TPR) repeat protein
VIAQDAEDAFKTAKKDLSQYFLDPGNKADKLEEAKNAIETAVAGIDQIKEKKREDVYLEKGKIYNAIAAKSKKADDALKAYMGFKQTFDMTDKGYKKKEAMDGMAEASSYLSNAGSASYGETDYAGAFKCFDAIIKINDLLIAEGHNKIPLEDETKYNELVFFAGLSAKTAGLNAESKELFEKLMSRGYDKAYVFEAMYDLTASQDIDKALGYLQKGREKYPTDQGLLYAEINYYIKEGKLDNLIDKIKQAIAGDPGNLSLYTALGSVYDNLSQREEQAGNLEKSQEYFNNALDYYEQAIEKDDTNVDALYSIGVLYYNKAAVLTEEMIALQDDLSREGQRQYEAKRSQMLDLFSKALPYFKRAEILNPDDRNTLIALKEIYAKKGGVEDLKISNEFKRRYEVVEQGGTNEESYYKDKE